MSLDSLITTRLELNQIDLLDRADLVGASLSAPVDQLWAEVLSILERGDRDYFRVLRRLRKALENLPRQMTQAMLRGLGDQAWRAYLGTFQVLADSLPKDYLLAAAGEALGKVLVGSTQESNQGLLEADEYRVFKTDVGGVETYVVGYGEEGDWRQVTSFPTKAAATAYVDERAVAARSLNLRGQIEALHVFRPPSREEVSQVIESPDRNDGLTWRERLNKWTGLLTDHDSFSAKVASGMSQGQNVQELAREVRPLVQGVDSAARRIARTEAMRVSHAMQLRTYDSFGTVIGGFQIRAVFDENTRPYHAARSGVIFWKDRRRRPNINDAPELPDEPNCRCWYTPVTSSPDFVKQDPAKIALFYPKDQVVPDPAVYTKWWNNQANLDQKKKVVGAKRWAVLDKKLKSIGRSPEFSDFIHPKTGKLLTLPHLKGESLVDLEARKKDVEDLITQRETYIHQISRYGFIPPEDIIKPPPRRRGRPPKPKPPVGPVQKQKPINPPDKPKFVQDIEAIKEKRSTQREAFITIRNRKREELELDSLKKIRDDTPPDSRDRIDKAIDEKKALIDSLRKKEAQTQTKPFLENEDIQKAGGILHKEVDKRLNKLPNVKFAKDEIKRNEDKIADLKKGINDTQDRMETLLNISDERTLSMEEATELDQITQSRSSKARLIAANRASQSDQKAIINSYRKDAFNSALKEIRPLGNRGKTKWAKGSEAENRRVFEKVEESLPSHWLEESNRRVMRTRAVKRGFYEQVTGTEHYPDKINISGAKGELARKTRVAFHEYGHRFEHVIQGVSDAERVFYQKRTQGKALKWIGPGYERIERGRDGNFIHPYIMRDYGSQRYYEILSTGIESIQTGQIGSTKVNIDDDPEYRDLIYGMLAIL